MSKLTGKVALVTGASRGIGKGIALSLGEAGATVYITGRTTAENQAAVPLTGSITTTTEEVTTRGGEGIAIQCDHNVDEQVQAVFEHIQADQGRLDILVNNAWKGYEGYHTNRYPPPLFPFWERPVTFWDENLAGVRWSYVATTLAAPLMVAQEHGLIVNISFGALTPGNVAYNIAKSATDRLTVEVAHSLKSHNVSVVSLYPGLVRTEGVLLNAEYFDLSNSESPEFTGRAVVALAADERVHKKSGDALVVAELAQEYDFNDIDGNRPLPLSQD
ncbi:MAG: SDR family NAD(P)-dependent oxidoreductase [Anaerolineales bacterium]|nr:SDR family NAD(P)-dependent oxidoreductase [Anaerolineales bacterium]